MYGIVDEDGTTQYLAEPFPVPSQIDSSNAYKLRFSTACHGAACARWGGNSCALIGRVIEEFAEFKTNRPPNEDNAEEPMQDCAIRSSCRWHFQDGLDACKACRFVTYLNGTEKQLSTVD